MRLRRRVVFPEPRKPVMIVIGMGMVTFSFSFLCLTVDNNVKSDGDTFYTGGVEALILIWKP
jgi:hypothetical protein